MVYGTAYDVGYTTHKTLILCDVRCVIYDMIHDSRYAAYDRDAYTYGLQRGGSLKSRPLNSVALH